MEEELLEEPDMLVFGLPDYRDQRDQCRHCHHRLRNHLHSIWD